MVGIGPDPAADAAEMAAARPTLSRIRHRALLALVRPAEAAARRLVIALALAIPAAPGAATPDEPRLATPDVPHRPRRAHMPRQPVPGPTILRDGTGTGIVLPRPGPGAAALPAWARCAHEPAPIRILRLPLADPARRIRVRRVAMRDLPRIWAPGSAVPFRPPLPPEPAPHDRLDATRLVLRIRALASALDDMPGEARRFRRWHARRAAEAAEAMRLAGRGPAGATAAPAAGATRRHRRISPLRTGRPPGGRRRPTHEVHAILNEAHGLAFDALARRDTS